MWPSDSCLIYQPQDHENYDDYYDKGDEPFTDIHISYRILGTRYN